MSVMLLDLWPLMIGRSRFLMIVFVILSIMGWKRGAPEGVRGIFRSVFFLFLFSQHNNSDSVHS